MANILFYLKAIMESLQGIEGTMEWNPELEGFQFIGVATPSTAPGDLTQKVFYLASEPGTYTNFNSIVVEEGEVAALKWDGSSWSKEATGVASADYVAKKQDAPISAGSSGQILGLGEDGKSEWKTPTEGSVMDDNVTENSENPVKSSGIYAAISQVGQQVTELGQQILAPAPQIRGFALKSDGTLVSNASYSVSDYIPITGIRLIHYTGSVSSSYVNVLGYDSNKENPTTLLSNTIYKDQDLVIPDGIAFVRMCAKNEYGDGYVAIFFGVYENRVIVELLNEKIDAIIPKLGERILFNNVGQLKGDGTIAPTAVNFDTSDFIPVNKGDIVLYWGYTAGSPTYAPIVGYDSLKLNATILQETKRNVPVEITIPDGVSFIRVSAANSGHASYNGRYCKIIPIYYQYARKEATEIYHLPFAATSTTRIWSGPIRSGGIHIIRNTASPATIGVYSAYSSSALIRTISSDEIISLGNNLYRFDITKSDMEAGALYLRFNFSNAFSPEFDCYTEISYDKFEQIYPIVNPLKGKKIAVIGDSISSSAAWNTPYITIQSVDVGHQIQSYITFYDVYGYDSSDPLVPLGTTIGGVELIPTMIGTLQTFTPVAADVGKKLGQAEYYNGVGTYVWCKKLCDDLDAIPLANASWSGASMCSGQSGERKMLSHAFSPLTIGRCRTRDAEGNYVNPDVIIIFRGGNDFSHLQGTGADEAYSMLDEYDIEANGYPQTDVYQEDGHTRYGFRRAYYMTIAALREAYPNAIIYCATLSIIKRVIYDRFPTRNGMYSLPQMNNVIREIANEMGCGIVEFDKCGITFENCYSQGYITDSATMPTHPNSKGHAVMARQAIHDIKQTL